MVNAKAASCLKQPKIGGVPTLQNKITKDLIKMSEHRKKQINLIQQIIDDFPPEIYKVVSSILEIESEYRGYSCLTESDKKEIVRRIMTHINDQCKPT